MPHEAYVIELFDRHLGCLPSPACVAALAELPVERAEVRAFVERMFRLMRRGRFSSNDLSILQCEVVGSLLSRILPGAWEGRVPPITVAGRHARIDEYLVRNPWQPLGSRGLLVDLGCGFPPVTTLETADRLRGWRILGADPALPSYLVYDDDDNYATFDEHRRMVYCQPASPTAENWSALLSDAAATRARFETLLAAKLEAQPADTGEQADSALSSGARLIVDPVRQFEREELSFSVGGIGALDIKDVDVVRCLNVLYYFDDAFFSRALAWFQRVLREGGLLVTGGNWTHTTECRYCVRQKEDGRLVAREFAFSIDNTCPIAILPWFTLHDDDREIALLTELLHVLRSDTPFLDRLIARSDALRTEYDICPRGADGQYGGVDSELPPAELWERAALIGQTLAVEFVDEAVRLLQSAGFEAWHNEVDHVAVQPARSL
ncbi:MAG: class I SAM-dependent methyltransferase [Planctomycetota bacterium]|jgi:hypothetical protein